MRFRRATIFLTAALACAAGAAAADSTLKEQDMKSLGEDFADVVKQEKCIVMYYNPAVADTTGQANPFEMTPQQIGDLLVREMIALRDRAGSSVKFYKVNWQDFPPATVERLRLDLESVYKQPENPSFAAFGRDGKMIFKVRGLARPDVLAWFVNEMMDEFIPSVPTDKGEYLRAGWTTTDTTAKFVNLVNLRYEDRTVNGKLRHVRVNSFRSLTFDDYSCEYEQIFLPNGRLFGALETYGPYGTVGYYDYDGTGKLQYRVKYRGNPGDGTASAPSQSR